MRRLVRSEVGLVVAFAVATLVTYVGLAVCVSGHDRLAGFLVLVAGAWSMVQVPVVHDRQHRENGEAAHALWGRDDRRKPRWWPPVRPG